MGNNNQLGHESESLLDNETFLDRLTNKIAERLEVRQVIRSAETADALGMAAKAFTGVVERVSKQHPAS